jgi:hypothetical protein
MVRLFKREPEDPQELINKAKKLIQKNKNEKAVVVLDIAIEKDPSLVDATLRKQLP